MRDTVESPLIADLRVDGSTIHVTANESFSNRYLQDDFFAEYEPDVDLSALPRTTLAIPFLTSVLPIVWATGGHFCIDEMDAQFARSLEEVRAGFRRMIPAIAWEGSLTITRLADDRRPAENGARGPALLFSGGVDSVYSSLTQPAPQLLVTVWGTDIALENREGWLTARRQTLSFAEVYGHEAAFIRSNFRTFINCSLLEDSLPQVSNWWLHVQHGIGLCGIAAPVIIGKGYERILLSSGRMLKQRGVLGASPELEGRLRWARVQAEHYGDDRTRHDKLRSIIGHVRDRPLARPGLRVCFMYPYGAGGNCSRCEKCLRTMSALLVENEAPAAWGFPRSARSTVRLVRRRFRMRMMLFAEGPGWFWGEIQSRAKEILAVGQAPVVEGVDLTAFLRWLSDFDLAAYQQRWQRLGDARASILRLIRRHPLLLRLATRTMAAIRKRRARARFHPAETDGVGARGLSPR
jgi:hypothetical protein